MVIEKVVLIWDCDGNVLGAFNDWKSAKNFMCKDYLETVKQCEWNNFEIDSYEQIANQICDDLKCLYLKGYVEGWYNAEEIKTDLYF